MAELFLCSNSSEVPELVSFTENFCIDLNGVNVKCINDYAAQEGANDSKLHIFVTKHNSDIYNEH